MFRTRPSKEPTHFLLPVNFLLHILVYNVAGQSIEWRIKFNSVSFTDDYALSTLFCLCSAFLSVIMTLTGSKRGSLQTLTVIAIYTIGFTTIAPLLALNCKRHSFIYRTNILLSLTYYYQFLPTPYCLLELYLDSLYRKWSCFFRTFFLDLSVLEN